MIMGFADWLKKCWQIGGVALLLILTSIWAQGQDTTGDPPVPAFELPNLWLFALKMLFWLLIVTGLIFVTVWVLKKLMLQSQPTQSVRPINIIFEEPISPAKSVCLIRVLDQMHVVGVTNANISYIATLDEDEVTLVDQWLENELILERRVKTGFQSFLRNFVRKTGK